MKNENKKTVLHLVTIAAISFSIVSLFAPVLNFNITDISEDRGWDVDKYWKADIYFFVQDYTMYDYRNIFNRSNVAHTYFFLYFFRYSTEEWAKEDLTTYDLDGNPNSVPSSRVLGNMIEFIFGGLFFILFFYFLYRAIKKCGKEKTKDFLYAGGAALAVVIGFTISAYYIFNTMDLNKLNYINYIKLDYGFYYMIISSCLFFIGYFLQNFIDFTKININENKILELK